MAKHSKRFQQAFERVDRTKNYEPSEALSLLKELPGAKFDETVEVAVKLGIDPKKSDQLVRGAVSLPKGLGKSVKVVVFAEGTRPRPRRRPVPTRSVWPSSPTRSPAAGWTSTS